ncbi:Ubiquitin-conjugating enzyme E2 13 [Tritrichomonas foetus]|uniref:Ubiquitin-conjugating enzyme E2 13 n=1 Tax=Tritrichomonas foetus TaxID=1144522 RepID=A0A1J4K1Y9_9EUKA|nr:Ubiquitin-conjugating enzyme E2 13 [Tritrichomonas foetus]|eukprot:OHT05407.1 Ubiquitin-conjugating enzyme E2 13 [Tritrichomonas foetus]
MTAIKRLETDKRSLTLRPIDGVNISWPNNNIREWLVQIEGPAGSLYENDIFDIYFTFKDDYPKHAPKVQMKTPIVHPNVDINGAVCVDVLRVQYNNTVDVRKIIEGIINALEHPNEKGRLNAQVGDLMLRDMAAFEAKARKQVATNIMNRAKTGQ